GGGSGGDRPTPPPSSRGRPARSSAIPSHVGDHLAARLAKYLVFRLAVADEEPIQAGAAVQVVDGVVVVDRRLGTAVGSVPAAAQGAVEVFDARVVIDVGAARLLHDRQPRRD